jgi:hypothetical protein
MNKAENTCLYEVLNPWSEIDPVTLQAPAARLDSLEGKKIGLFCNFKRSARPILETAASWLQERFPSITTSFYVPEAPNVPAMESGQRDAFRAWVEAQDGVILAVGD